VGTGSREENASFLKAGARSDAKPVSTFAERAPSFRQVCERPLVPPALRNFEAALGVTSKMMNNPTA
jgi:hypothetical protein